MLFKEIDLTEGRVLRERVKDTHALDSSHIEQAARLLRQLRLGQKEAAHSQAGLVPFSFRLGLPDDFHGAGGSALFFCVGEPGIYPFQFSVVIHPNTPRDAGVAGLLAALEISCRPERSDGAALLPLAHSLFEERPLVATAMPPCSISPQLLYAMNSAIPLFAAAWLLEP